MAFSLCCKKLLNRVPHVTSSVRHGYIVLVPEIGEDLPDKNPLLKQNGLPEFSKLTIEHCMVAIGKQTVDFEAGVEEIETQILNNDSVDAIKDVMEPLETLNSSLDTTWGLAKTLYLGNNTVMPTKSYLAIHDRARRARATKFNSTPIYNIVKKRLEKKDLPEEQSRMLKKFELEGKLNGLGLNNAGRTNLVSCLNKLAIEKTKFKTKIEAATKLFRCNVSKSQINNFSSDLQKLMASNPKQYQEGPWTMTLQSNLYLPFMENCSDRELRWNVWQAMVSRGSLSKNKEYSTSVHLEEIRYLRKDQANLLGYKTFADMSMETKMAGSVENVTNMLHTLLLPSFNAQKEELLDLYDFALKNGFDAPRIELWDVPYWSKKQRQHLFNYNEDNYRNYFQLPKVLEGLFSLCERLFNVTIKIRSDVSTWDREVQFYDVFEPHSSAPVAGFYLDPYMRNKNKLGNVNNNGWMVGIQNRSQIADTKPLAALIFNFQSPTSSNPSLLSFKDVQLLFFKFGHCLQHLLAQTNFSEVSGLSNVEWDAVEVSGHVFCQWLYNRSVLDSISCHNESGDKLPDEMYSALCNVRKHMAGVDLCRELYLSALDLELHSSKAFWLDVVKGIWPQYRCFPLDKVDAHPCSFMQIFVDDWAGAYYCHLWSRLISADVCNAFLEVEDNEQQLSKVGKRFRETFLSLGGSCNASEVFRKFRGRDLSPTALLNCLDLENNENTKRKKS